MKKIKNVKIGDCVLLSRWSDKDPRDPWTIGLICEYGEDKKGMFYKIENVNRYFRHAWKLTIEESEELFSKYNSII